MDLKQRVGIGWGWHDQIGISRCCSTCREGNQSEEDKNGCNVTYSLSSLSPN